MAAFYYDTDKKLVEIFTEHCNLSGEQYEWIQAEFRYMVADIQDDEPEEEILNRMNDMGTVFTFLVETNCLTLKEHYDLMELLWNVWESRTAENEGEVPESGAEP